MRFLVFPFLTEKFGNFIPNLLNIGKQSSDCSKTINRTIIEPFFRENIKFNKNGIYFEINNDIKNFEDTIWNIIFTKIFHDLDHSNNSIENFIKTIKSSRNEGFINLSKFKIIFILYIIIKILKIKRNYKYNLRIIFR